MEVFCELDVYLAVPETHAMRIDIEVNGRSILSATDLRHKEPKHLHIGTIALTPSDTPLVVRYGQHNETDPPEARIDLIYPGQHSSFLQSVLEQPEAFSHEEVAGLIGSCAKRSRFIALLPTATSDDLDQAEQRIGFPLMPVHRRLLERVGAFDLGDEYVCESHMLEPATEQVGPKGWGYDLQVHLGLDSVARDYLSRSLLFFVEANDGYTGLGYHRLPDEEYEVFAFNDASAEVQVLGRGPQAFSQALLSAIESITNGYAEDDEAPTARLRPGRGELFVSRQWAYDRVISANIFFDNECLT